MFLNTTKGRYWVTNEEAAAEVLAELVPSAADLDGREIDVPHPNESSTDDEWLAACRAAVVRRALA